MKIEFGKKQVKGGLWMANHFGAGMIAGCVMEQVFKKLGYVHPFFKIVATVPVFFTALTAAEKASEQSDRLVDACATIGSKVTDRLEERAMEKEEHKYARY